MAVIITNMDMPKNCMDCIFGYCYYEGGATGLKCYLTKESSYGESKEKDSNFRFYCCPLKPVNGLITEEERIPTKERKPETLKMVQEVIRGNAADHLDWAMTVIEEALRNGYTLCKVDEAIERIKFETKNSRADYDLGRNFGLMLASKIVEECCE